MSAVRRGSTLPLLLLAGAAVAGSCTDVSTSPTKAIAISFDTLPFPAVVTGDTLRDSLGRVAPLHALAINSSNAVIANAGITYLALDTGLTIDASGVLTAQLRNGVVRLVASVNGLQSVTKSITITRRPDTVFATAKPSDTLHYALPDNATSNVFAGLGVRVLTNDTSGGITTAQGWLVSYQALFHGVPLPPSDTTLASLWDAGGKVSVVDTTRDGLAGRRLRVRPQAPGFTAAESLIVLVTVRYRGAQLRGSPVRFVVHTRPR